IMLQDVLVLAIGRATSPDELAAQNNPTPVAAPAPARPTPVAARSITAPQPAGTPTPAAATAARPAPAPVTSAAQRSAAAGSLSRTVTVAVAPEAVERLALAQAHGDLSYVIRPRGDRAQQSVLPADLGTLAS